MKTLKQILSELYSEPNSKPGESTFTHDGVNYDLNGLLTYTLGMEQKMVPVSRLKWILKWDPMTQRDNPRINRADLSAPILVIKWHSQLVVLDGIHRLARALRDGVQELPAIFVPEWALQKNRIETT